MKRILICLSILAVSICVQATWSDYLVADMSGRYGLGLQGYHYSPRDARDEIGNRVDDWMISGYWYHFNTRKSSIEFGVGLWDESTNGLKSKIRHITIGMSWYENLENNFKFFYGADLGSFRLETRRMDNLGVINSYSDSDLGLQLKLGLAYLMSVDFWAKAEVRYTGCTIDDMFPNPPHDSSISDTNYAMSFIAFF